MEIHNNSDIKIDASLLNSLQSHIGIIDQEGMIIQTNKAWDSFSAEDTLIKRTQEGTNFFEMLQQAIELGNDYALKLLLGMNKVIAGKKDSYSLTYPLQTNTNSFWFKLTMRPCNNGQRYVIVQEDISTSVEAKTRLEKNQNRYQIQFEQSLDGILITDAEGNIIDANPAASNILGRDHDELINCTHKDITDLGDSGYQKALSERKKSGTYQIETNLLHKSGRKIPVEISSRAYRTPTGKLRAIVSFRDISQRKEIEDNFLKHKDFTESALNSIPGVFLVLDSKGNIVRWNNHMTNNLGYNAQELAGKNALDFIIDDQKEEIRQKMEECFQSGELSVETKVYSKKKEENRDYHLFAKRFVEDGEPYLVGTGIDITENKITARKNRENQNKLEQLFDNAPVGMAVVNKDNNITQVNDSFEKIFGFDHNEVIQEDINKLLVPEDKRDEANAISLATLDGKSLQIETIRLNKSGQEVPVLIGSVPVELRGETIAIYGIYVDMTSQQEYQHKIEHALHEKNILLAELHHRVKNNLALINSLLELQAFESENSELNEQLSQVKNRIVTIASIHEVLYQQGKLNNIPFSDFLDEFISNGSFQQKVSTKAIDLDTEINQIELNINQSIPCGLLLNEILSLIFEFTDTNVQNDISLRFRQYSDQLHMIIEGYDIVKSSKEIRNGQSLHNILIEQLVKQLEGTLLWPNTDSEYQKFELIFTKQSSYSPARHLLKNNSN